MLWPSSLHLSKVNTSLNSIEHVKHQGHKPLRPGTRGGGRGGGVQISDPPQTGPTSTPLTCVGFKNNFLNLWVLRQHIGRSKTNCVSYSSMSVFPLFLLPPSTKFSWRNLLLGLLLSGICVHFFLLCPPPSRCLLCVAFCFLVVVRWLPFQRGAVRGESTPCSCPL